MIKLISRLKLYEKRQRDAKMLNVEIMEKLKLDLLKNIVVYEIELKQLDEFACASTNHFNNISRQFKHTNYYIRFDTIFFTVQK